MPTLSDLLQYAVGGISTGAIYAIVAVGFTIVFSSTELVNLAQGEFVMLGALLSYTFRVALGWDVWLAVAAASTVASLVGTGLGALLTRPLRKATPMSLIIMTIGASMLLQGVAGQIWGKDAVALPPFTQAQAVLIGMPGKGALPVVVLPQQLWVVGLVAAMVLGLSVFFGTTMQGRALRAVAANRLGAGLVGIRVGRLVVGAFALSAAMGAVAGAAVAPISCGYFNMGTVLGLKGFAAAVVGGLGSFGGSVVAGLGIGLLESFGAGYISSDYKDAMAFVVLLAVLFISPDGLGAGVLARRLVARGRDSRA